MDYGLSYPRHHRDSRSRSPELAEHYTRVHDHDDYVHHAPHHSHHHHHPHRPAQGGAVGAGGGGAGAAAGGAPGGAAPAAASGGGGGGGGGAHHRDRDGSANGSPGASAALSHHRQPHRLPPPPQPMQHQQPQQQQQQQGSRSAPVPGSVVFVTNLSSKATTSDLEALFSRYGTVTKASVICDPHTRESRGFAFVNFDTAEAAGHAAQSANGIELHGRPVKAEIARSTRPRTPTPGRYIGDEKRRPRDAYPPMRRPVMDYRESYREPYREPNQDPYTDNDPYRRRRYSPPPLPVSYAPAARYADRYAPPARDPYVASRNVYDRRSPQPPAQPPVYMDERLYDHRPSPRPYYSPAPAPSHGYDHYSRPTRY